MDVAKTQCHETTLARLKESLPVLEALAANGRGVPGHGRATRVAADELRTRFPGLDDLTLAAFAAYESQLAAKLAVTYGDRSQYAAAMAAALIACDLAWEIRESP